MDRIKGLKERGEKGQFSMSKYSVCLVVPFSAIACTVRARIFFLCVKFLFQILLSIKNENRITARDLQGKRECFDKLWEKTLRLKYTFLFVLRDPRRHVNKDCLDVRHITMFFYKGKYSFAISQIWKDLSRRYINISNVTYISQV